MENHLLNWLFTFTEDECTRKEPDDDREIILPYFQDEVPIGFTPEFVQENRRAARVPKIKREQLAGSTCAWAVGAAWTAARRRSIT